MRKRTIVAATDFSTRAEIALASARQAAQMLGAERIHLVHVLDTGLGGSPLPYDIPEAQAENAREEAVRRARTHLEAIDLNLPGVTKTIEVCWGEPGYEIARAADSVDAGLIVVATQGRGAVGRAIVGSVTSALLGYADCPVMVTGKDRRPMNDGKKVLASVDMSPISVPVLLEAQEIVRSTKGSLNVLSVYQRPFSMPGEHPLYFGNATRAMEIEAEADQRTQLNSLVAQTLPDFPVNTEVVVGLEASEKVRSYVEDTEPDLLVVGASGIRTWGRRIFGTNAERIVAKAHCTVIVVPDSLRRGVEVEAQFVASSVDKSKQAEGDQLVFALFDDEKSVRSAIAKMVEENIPTEDITVLMARETHESFADRGDDVFTAGGALGASVGGVMGGLASMGTAVGVGLMVVGPAVTLGLAGGLVATLLGFGVPTPVARKIEEAVSEGKALVGAHSRDFETQQKVKTALTDAGGLPKRLAL